MVVSELRDVAAEFGPFPAKGKDNVGSAMGTIGGGQDRSRRETRFGHSRLAAKPLSLAKENYNHLNLEVF